MGRVGVVFLMLAGVGAMAFETPKESERLRAIGSVDNLPQVVRRAFQPGRDFAAMPAPGPDDWLAAHPEPGQSFAEFVRSRPNRPDKQRKIIYLQPLGDFPSDEAPPQHLLQEYAAAYFAMEVRLLPSLSLNGQRIKERHNPTTRKRQLLATDILTVLKKRIPQDAFCLLGITMEDLYPEPSWNFVFGQASLRERVGVYSFARYDPAFYGQPRGNDHKKILLRRSCKVLAHEIGHMFGLLHCIYYRCALNGSNHLAESDARPMHVCPVDLHKLHHSIRFDVARRYAALSRFYRKVGFEDEAEWTKKRLEWVIGENEAKRMIEDRGEGA
jgi:archaemetzincin